jgi:hypothetical protein
VGVKETVDDNIIFTPDQLNTFFATSTVTRPSTNNVDPGRNPRNVEFAFAAIFELEVFNARFSDQVQCNMVCQFSF